MNWLDRFIVLVLAAGVWALVLQPLNTTAHDNNDHSCSGDGYGYGEMDGREVYVHTLDITCEHY